MGEPIDDAQEATPADVVFFRQYVSMSEAEKERYRAALDLMFGTKPDEGQK